MEVAFGLTVVLEARVVLGLSGLSSVRKRILKPSPVYA